jgi:hypothetical protein
MCIVVGPQARCSLVVLSFVSIATMFPFLVSKSHLLFFDFDFDFDSDTDTDPDPDYNLYCYRDAFVLYWRSV